MTCLARVWLAGILIIGSSTAAISHSQQIDTSSDHKVGNIEIVKIHPDISLKIPTKYKTVKSISRVKDKFFHVKVDFAFDQNLKTIEQNSFKNQITNIVTISISSSRHILRIGLKQAMRPKKTADCGRLYELTCRDDIDANPVNRYYLFDNPNMNIVLFICPKWAAKLSDGGKCIVNSYVGEKISITYSIFRDQLPLCHDQHSQIVELVQSFDLIRP